MSDGKKRTMSNKHMRPNSAVPKCNLCGETCGLDNDAYKDGTDNCTVGGLIDQEVMGGYWSTPGNGEGALDDTIAYKFSLCEFCCDWLFSQFKIPPAMRDYMAPQGDGSDWGVFLFPEEAKAVDEAVRKEVFRPAEQRVREDDWREEKEEYFVEAKRRDMARGKFGEDHTKEEVRKMLGMTSGFGEEGDNDE